MKLSRGKSPAYDITRDALILYVNDGETDIPIIFSGELILYLAENILRVRENTKDNTKDNGSGLPHPLSIKYFLN